MENKNLSAEEKEEKIKIMNDMIEEKKYQSQTLSKRYDFEKSLEIQKQMDHY